MVVRRTQHKIDRYVAVKPAAERTGDEPIARPTLLSRILQWKDRGWRNWRGPDLFNAWATQTYIDAVINHETRGLHPTLHDAESCGSYKALLASARRMRDYLNSLDLGD